MKLDFRGEFVMDEKPAHTAFRVSWWAEGAGKKWGGKAVAEMDDRAAVP